MAEANPCVAVRAAGMTRHWRFLFGSVERQAGSHAHGAWAWHPKFETLPRRSGGEEKYVVNGTPPFCKLCYL